MTKDVKKSNDNSQKKSEDDKPVLVDEVIAVKNDTKNQFRDFFADIELSSVDNSLESLLKAGAHFGHQKSRRHPRMESFIFGIRGGITIIDLEKTQKGIQDAQKFLSSVKKSGKKILFVTTKKQVLDLVESAARRAQEPFVVRRWIGGTFTNFRAIRQRVRYLMRMENELEKGSFHKYTKLEQLRKREEVAKLNRKMGGLKEMGDLPGAIVVIDVKADILAIQEARHKNIPIVAITDTNVDPTLVDYQIPANDDAISSVKLILTLLLNAISNNNTSHSDIPKVEVKKNVENVELSSKVKK